MLKLLKNYNYSPKCSSGDSFDEYNNPTVFMIKLCNLAELTLIVERCRIIKKCTY
jgi:hypothetical protein